MRLSLLLLMVVFPLGHLVVLLLKPQNGCGRQQGEVLLTHYSQVKVLVKVLMQSRHAFVIAHPNVGGFGVATLEEVLGNTLQKFGGQFEAQCRELFRQIIILVLDIGHSIWVELLPLKEVFDVGLLLVGFHEVSVFDAICKAVRSQGDGLLLIFQYLRKILCLAPSLEDVISLEGTCDNAGDVLGDEFLVEPHWVELDFVPADRLDLCGKPGFGGLLNLVRDGIILMGGLHYVVIDGPLLRKLCVVKDEGGGGLKVVILVEFTGITVALHLLMISTQYLL